MPRFLSSRLISSHPAHHRPGAGAAARALVCGGVLGLLSACAGGPHVSASQEAGLYERHARESYAAPGSAGDPWGPYIHEAASRYDVPERWIREVMRVESGGRTEMYGRPITSGAGAMGLMQVMPATYDELRRRYSLGDDAFDPHDNIMAGAAYIRELYDLYGSPGFLAAYNSGPGRLDDYLTRNRPLPDETRRYVAKIGPRIADSFPAKRSMAEMYAMNSVPASIPAGPRYAVPDDAAASAPAPSQPPVEVAYAPPSASDAAFDPPPGWTPPRMASPDAAYVPPPAPPQPVAPPPLAVAADLPPPPRFSPAPMPLQEADAALPAPPAIPPAIPPLGPPARVPPSASLPEPPRPMPVQTASADNAGPSNSGWAPQALRRENGFRLVSPANAAPAPVYRGSPGQWAIQVGAFGNEGLAHIAVGTAREQAGAVLSGARPAVAGVREPHGTLYRARLTGLSRDAATQACERLRGRSACIVLSPDAQS